MKNGGRDRGGMEGWRDGRLLSMGLLMRTDKCLHVVQFDEEKFSESLPGFLRDEGNLHTLLLASQSGVLKRL